MEKANNGQGGAFMRKVGVLGNVVAAIAAGVFGKDAPRARFNRGNNEFYISPADWYNHKSGLFGKNRRKELKRRRR